jgi:hypothetical protein
LRRAAAPRSGLGAENEFAAHAAYAWIGERRHQPAQRVSRKCLACIGEDEHVAVGTFDAGVQRDGLAGRRDVDQADRIAKPGDGRRRVVARSV